MHQCNRIGRNGLKVYQAYCRENGKSPKQMRVEAKAINTFVPTRPHKRPILSCKVKNMTPRQIKNWMLIRDMSDKGCRYV